MRVIAPRTPAQRYQFGTISRMVVFAVGVALLVGGLRDAIPFTVVLGSVLLLVNGFTLVVGGVLRHKEHRAQLETGWLDELPLTYGAIGDTAGHDFMADPPRWYRALERRRTIGAGSERFGQAADGVLRWQVKIRSGFRVIRVGTHGAFVSDAPVAKGECAIVTLGPIRETVRVVWIVDEPRRRGFAYGTLPEHPLRGEESFIVEWRDDDAVELVVRSFSRPRSLLWFLLYPALLLAQQFFVRRYLRVLLE